MIEDLSVFFDGDDFAVEVVRERDGVDDLTFFGIDGFSDVDTLQGNVQGDQRTLLMPLLDVLDGDTLLIEGVPARVLQVETTNDGKQMRAFLSELV